MTARLAAARPGPSHKAQAPAHEARPAPPNPVWQRLATTPARVQRQPADDQEPPKMTVSGDAERKSPSGGVAISNGSLEWNLKYVGKDTTVTHDKGTQFNMVMGRDVLFEAGFTPTAGSTKCPTITFSQSVTPTVGGLWDPGPLLYTRSPTTNATMDVLYQDPAKPDTEPIYGAEPKPGGGLKASGSNVLSGSGPGAAAKATHSDAPYHQEIAPGKTAVRAFETAVICVETGETFGSIAWGYTKTGAGVVTLQGATSKDVRTTSASPGFETTRQAFYSGFFERSLSGFATGSATLTAAHKTQLDGIDVKDLTRMILVGANDNSGGPEAKADLSVKRAEAARDYLVKTRGVSKSIIRTEGHGVEAREPNPPGKDVPANRRVDVHTQRGAETPAPAVRRRRGSTSELKRILKQNPRKTVDEAVDMIVRLDGTTGRISMMDWDDLSVRLRAVDLWRRDDPTVPDLRTIYSGKLNQLNQRAQLQSTPVLVPRPGPGPTSLEDLQRQRADALRKLNEEAKELEEP
ncbi:MAG TPA: OmpA family protein [Thermoanaerobaculia bacterium]|jgi:outer membrane protein OmpA-like peptidoglycan-associated protein|nr:OmpA family protein [Thermoanaerobaculia bacterium]